MAVNPNDKVFVVNENINTTYGGVDPTGSFKTLGELSVYESIVMTNIVYNETGISLTVVQSSFPGSGYSFGGGLESVNGFTLNLEGADGPLNIDPSTLVILTGYNWNEGAIFSAVLEESDLPNGSIRFRASDLAGNRVNSDGASFELRIYPAQPD